MPRLFEPARINSLETANRLVRSATWMGMAEDDGTATPRLTECLTALAQGGVGLIIAGHTFVSPEGQASWRQTALYDEKFIPAQTELTGAVHAAGGKIVCQLAHAGARARVDLSGRPAKAMTPDIEGVPDEAEEWTTAELDQLSQTFARAADFARRAGYDAVQLHAAHGYFINQTLSPHFNRRTDRYGDGQEGRHRFAVQTIRLIRETLGPDYPILVKLNGNDFMPGGLTPQSSLDAAKAMIEAGVDAVEISGGAPGAQYLPSRTKIEPGREAYHRAEAEIFRQNLNVPLILVGGVKSYDVAEELIESDTVDFVAMARPFIREPGLARRWEQGDRRPAECDSDNLCFRPPVKGEHVYCLTEEREKKK
jgi:2,4-dienoyl-CoA reductase-like NADH-dependent reductase (Old Yellow Enzyme family)